MPHGLCSLVYFWPLNIWDPINQKHKMMELAFTLKYSTTFLLQTDIPLMTLPFIVYINNNVDTLNHLTNHCYLSILIIL